MDVFTSFYLTYIKPLFTRSNTLKIILGFIDVLVIALAFQCSYIIRYFEKGGFFFNDINLLSLFIGILPFWLLIFYIIKKTGIPTRRYKVILLLFLQSSVMIFFLLVLLYYILHLYTVSRLFLAEISLFGFLFLYLTRILTYKVLRRYGNKGHNLVNIVIIADDSSLPYIENIIENKKLEFKIVVIFSDSILIKEKLEVTSIILPEKYIDILNDLVEVDFVDEVLYLKQQTDSSKVRELLLSCEDLGIILRIRNNDPKITLSSAVQTDVVNGKFLTFINIPNDTFALAIKKTLDINLALLLIVVLSPAIIAISILIKIESRGPIISKISKMGWRGRNIQLYRFRTTLINAPYNKADLKSEIEIKRIVSEGKEDFPITNVGKFLIKSGLDMLPMLFNVLKGEITVTGLRHPLHSDNLKIPES